MKNKITILTAIALVFTSLAYAKSNVQLAIDQLGIDQSLNEEVFSLLKSDIKANADQVGDEKNWLKRDPLGYLKGKEITLAETARNLRDGIIKITDIADERTQFDIISYLMVHDKETFKKCIDIKANHWTYETTPLYYIADIDQGRTLFTQAVLAADKDVLADLKDNLPRFNDATNRELLIKTLETLIKVPESAKPPLDDKYINNRISKIEKRQPLEEKLIDYVDEEDEEEFARLIYKDRKELKELKKERNASEGKEQYHILNQPSKIDVAFFVIDGDIQALRDASGNIGKERAYEALAYLITHSKGNLGKNKK
jgi:hypothetical protein